MSWQPVRKSRPRRGPGQQLTNLEPNHGSLLNRSARPGNWRQKRCFANTFYIFLSLFQPSKPKVVATNAAHDHRHAVPMPHKVRDPYRYPAPLRRLKQACS